MNRKWHNHTLQTNPGRAKERQQRQDIQDTANVKQPALSTI